MIKVENGKAYKGYLAEAGPKYWMETNLGRFEIQKPKGWPVFPATVLYSDKPGEWYSVILLGTVPDGADAMDVEIGNVVPIPLQFNMDGSKA